MNNFKFDENNLTTTSLPLLTQSDKPGNSNFSSTHEKRRDSGTVELVFFGEGFEYTQMPSTEQLLCLDFISRNEKEILSLIFDYTKNTLYPVHIGYIGDDETSFPKLNGIDDLRKALGLKTIYIWREAKEQTSYYGLSYDFSGDFEHGTNILMHELRILGWEEDLNKEKIIIDLTN